MSRTAIVTLTLLCLLLAGTAIASVGLGAVTISPSRILMVLRAALTRDPALDAAHDGLILLDIRIPRTLLGFLVGAALAMSGALLQGLFRNPLADPGLIGVSAGAALAAAAAIVLGDRWIPGLLDGPWAVVVLPLAAFGGGLAATSILYGLATRDGRTSVALLLLAGVALGALAGAATGLLVYLSDDRQLRDLTFWSLGSLGGATWGKVATAAMLILPVLVIVPFLARSLNALALGEADAYYLGVPVQRTKRIMIGLVALAVGSSVALAGPIAFIGIVVPHLLRLTAGADHRIVLPASALLGGSLLVGADILARTLAAPAEVPIGILTAAIGAPFFLWLLLTRAQDIGA
ncbi:iron ABC transporter permease [Lichenihabitans sp. PAMC28606]|uniref:FecCD family ABC transporter permease n=1 Tax=Lichenihabitans sp. PAMC28606 TaxID=2880932 RepID=UPI001D0A9459|nr:iron ABC transporter permease [Lichenihabitans sp. PAMC28606]UDL95546.1 iron ABC transporter permease [Lichenihabitans sp. PAMC28606]